MKTAAIGWVLLGLCGCGGLVIFDRDGAGGGASDDDGPVASSGSGEASSGSGDASSGSGPDPACPAVKPRGGEACDTPNQVCDYGGFCNSVLCADGIWVLPVC